MYIHVVEGATGGPRDNAPFDYAALPGDSLQEIARHVTTASAIAVLRTTCVAFRRAIDDDADSICKHERRRSGCKECVAAATLHQLSAASLLQGVLRVLSASEAEEGEAVADAAPAEKSDAAGPGWPPDSQLGCVDAVPLRTAVERRRRRKHSRHGSRG